MTCFNTANVWHVLVQLMCGMFLHQLMCILFEGVLFSVRHVLVQKKWRNRLQKSCNKLLQSTTALGESELIHSVN